MPLDIQSGGFADKLRRALTLRGRMPLRLDETVVPVVQVQELDRPPYRTDAIDWGTNVDQPAIAAEFGFAGVRLLSTQPGAIVLDSIIVTAAVTDAYSIFIGPQADYDATHTAAPAGLPRNVENYPLSATLVDPMQMPFAQSRGTHPSLGLGGLVCTFRVLANTDREINWRIVLRPGWVCAVWRRTVNLDVNASFHGTYYPDAPAQ